MNPHAKIFDPLGPRGIELMIDRLVDNCGDRDDPRVMVLFGLKEERERLMLALKDYLFDEARVIHFESEEYRSPIFKDLAPVERPASLASSVIANQIVDLYYKGRRGPDGKWIVRPKELGAIVSLYQNPETRDRHLDIVGKLPVEIFFVDLPGVDNDGNVVEGMTERGGSAVELFDTREEFDALGTGLKSVIEGIAHTEEVTVIGGLPKDYKTYFLLSVVQALLTGDPLFSYFKVPEIAERVLYFIPEASRRSFYYRLKLMRLDQFLNHRLFVRTLSKGPAPLLDDPAILEAAKGADVFLDTVSRFATGDENAASDVKNFSAQLFGMLEAGARSVWAAHHSPKAFGEASKMTLENMLRGSGDIGAMLSNAYGLRKLDEDTGLVHVECLAGRDLPEPVKPFQLRARPYLNENGCMVMTKKPGEAGTLADHIGKKGAKREDPAKEEKRQLALDLSQQGKSVREIAAEVEVPKSTVADWLRDQEREEGRPGF